MIFETESAQSFLQEEFSRRVRLNPRYSLRAYSRTLGMSSGALSEILRRRRPVSLKAAAKIAKSLGLNPIEKKRLYEMIHAEKQNQLAEDKFSEPKYKYEQQKKLDLDTFYLISEWQHFAILNLIDCEGFQWNANYIAKRLGITISQAQMAMSLLLRLGLVEKNGDQYKGAQDFILSPSEVSSEAIRKYHRQMLEKAIEALELQDIRQRDISGLGLALDPVRLPQIKKEISDFQDQLAAKYSNGKKREVYFLEMALFKITQGVQDEKK